MALKRSSKTEQSNKEHTSTTRKNESNACNHHHHHHHHHIQLVVCGCLPMPLFCHFAPVVPSRTSIQFTKRLRIQKNKTKKKEIESRETSNARMEAESERRWKSAWTMSINTSYSHFLTDHKSTNFLLRFEIGSLSKFIRQHICGVNTYTCTNIHIFPYVHIVRQT